MKTVQELQQQYLTQYNGIPKDDHERLRYLINTLNISDEQEDRLWKIDKMMSENMLYETYTIVLYEEPIGKPRPRFKRVKGKNQVYSGNEYYRKKAFKEILTKEELEHFKQHLIATPCKIDYDVYLKTPKTFNNLETLLAEIGAIRPLNKPDWDNLGKEYSDLFNELVWIDDVVVISATVNKFYSILPRIEISFYVANALFNKYQYNSMKKKLPDRSFSYFRKGILQEG